MLKSYAQSLLVMTCIRARDLSTLATMLNRYAQSLLLMTCIRACDLSTSASVHSRAEVPATPRCAEGREAFLQPVVKRRLTDCFCEVSHRHWRRGGGVLRCAVEGPVPAGAAGGPAGRRPGRRATPPYSLLAALTRPHPPLHTHHEHHFFCSGSPASTIPPLCCR